MARQRLTDRSINRKPPASGQIEMWDSVLPGFGLRISYGGKRTYCVMTRINGRQVRRTVGTTATHKLAEAREAARDILRDAAKGIDPKDRQAQDRREAARAKRGNFGAVAKDFMEERTGHRADDYTRGRSRHGNHPDCVCRAGFEPRGYLGARGQPRAATH